MTEAIDEDDDIFQLVTHPWWTPNAQSVIILMAPLFALSALLAILFLKTSWSACVSSYT